MFMCFILTAAIVDITEFSDFIFHCCLMHSNVVWREREKYFKVTVMYYCIMKHRGR